MNDKAVYFRAQTEVRGQEVGTLVYATKGYNGPYIARLWFNRPLSVREEHDLDAAIRAGDRGKPSRSAEEEKV